MIKRVILLFSTVLIILSSCRKETDPFIAQKMEELHIPGLMTAVIKDGEIVRLQGYGYANLNERRSVTEKSVFRTSHFSHILAGLAALQLTEQGILDLNADINTYLPISVRNPAYPKVPITALMLLKQTSSLTDNMSLLDEIKTQGDSAKEDFAPFILGYFDPEGVWYDEKLNFTEYEPGEQFGISFQAVSLLALLVERLSGEEYDRYVQKHIFEPLDMTHSGFFYSQFTPLREVTPYAYAGNDSLALTKTGYLDYPSAQFMTTIVDLSHLIIALMHEGQYQGKRILSAESVEMMLSQQVNKGYIDENVGFFVGYLGYPDDGIGLWASDKGLYHEFFLSQKTKTAVIALSNGWKKNTGWDFHGFFQILTKLYESAGE